MLRKSPTVSGPPLVNVIAGAAPSLAALGLATAQLSNPVRGVPAALLLEGRVARFAAWERAWFAVAMASTPAGHFTIASSVAKLIVVGQTGAPVESSFWTHTRACLPLTLLLMVLGTAWLAWIAAPG